MTLPKLQNFAVVDDHDQGCSVKIYNSLGKETGITLQLAGPNSRRAKEFARSRFNQRAATGKRTLDAEFVEEAGYDELAHCTLSWTFPEEYADFECNFENALSLYKNYPDIYAQALAARGDSANFTKRA